MSYVLVAPPWEKCPACGHHEMSHVHRGNTYSCLVFECECQWHDEFPPGE
jgi:hypothetical protein